MFANKIQVKKPLPKDFSLANFLWMGTSSVIRNFLFSPFHMKTFITVVTTALVTTVLFLVMGKWGMLGIKPTPAQCPQGTTIVKTVETCTPPATGTQATWTTATGATMEVFSCTSWSVVAETVSKLLAKHYIATSCFAPDGNVYPEWAKLTFFATAQITANEPQPSCEKIEKTCSNGFFMGTGNGDTNYNHLTCRRIDPTDTSSAYCAHDNDMYLPGEIVYTYAHSNVTLDQDCKQALSICNGQGQRWSAFSGYNASSCSFVRTFSPSYLEKNKSILLNEETKLPKPESVACLADTGKSCTTPRATSIKHGASFVSFKEKSVGFDEECVAKSVTCNNGIWANNATPYQNQSCKKAEPAHCVINTTKFYHDTTTTLYKKTTNKDGSVACAPQERYCFDGVLSGSTDYKWRSCSGAVVEPKTTTTNQGVGTAPTLVTKPTTSSIAPSTSTYSASSKEPNCTSPFGGSPRAPGKQGVGYRQSSPSYSKWCTAESIVCAWGSIRRWTTTAPGEVVNVSLNSSCKALPPQDCTSACGQIEHGKQAITFTDNEISHGNWELCKDKQVVSTCNDGTLSPAAGKYCSCKISEPVGCKAPDGSKVANDQTLTLYQYPQVQAQPGDGSDTCVRQWRKCLNGDRYDRDGNQATFTYKYATCKVLPPTSESGQWGDGVPQG